jgi:hypothetical protein
MEDNIPELPKQKLVDMNQLFKKIPGIAKAKEITETAELLSNKQPINEATFTKTQHVSEERSFINENFYDKERDFDPITLYKQKFSTSTRGNSYKEKELSESTNLVEKMRNQGGIKGILENTQVTPKVQEVMDPRISKLMSQGKFKEAKLLNEELLKQKQPVNNKKINREQIINEMLPNRNNYNSEGKSSLNEAEIKNIVLKTVVNDIFDNKKIDKIITEKVEKLFENKINEMVNRKLAIALKRLLNK